MYDAEDVLDCVAGVGLYVIKKDNYEILYYNNAVKMLVPGIAIGMKSLEFYPSLNESIMAAAFNDFGYDKVTLCGMPFGCLSDIFAKGIMWRNKIPAYIISVVSNHIAENSELAEARAKARAAVLEKELNRKEFLIMLSQINPHFIFNTLNSIKGLIITDTKKACGLINDFSKYLRGSMNVLNKKQPVSFLSEIEYINTYLNIEMLRFPNIKIKYELKEKNFYIPPMCIQPLVENAVVHGVCQKEEGGLITISSYMSGDYIFIEVSDTGAGFILEEKEIGKRTDGSLFYISERLRVLLGGKLLISSKKQEGTMVTVKLPAENAVRKDYLML